MLVDLNGCADGPPRRRQRVDDPAENPEDKVAVQRFTLVSRGAPPGKRAPVPHNVLLAPPRVAAQLGEEVSICRCSTCDRSGLRRRMSGTRLCRRDTESHPEYALLLSMNERFEAECPEHGGDGTLVSDACCREKTAFFILGPGSTTIGYVAAEVAANRRVRRAAESTLDATEEMDPDDNVPTILQVYVEPEFRRRGYASEALGLLLRDHASVKVDGPEAAVLGMLERLGFTGASPTEGEYGRPRVLLVKSAAFEIEV